MKQKLFTLIFAALMSVSLFAAKDVVPSDAVLADYYEQDNVCVCIFVPADMACNDIVLTGSFNGWRWTVEECVPFEAIEGYEGWYVTSFEPEAEPDAVKGIQAKPVMLDVDGNFNWDYQIGAATVIRGGIQVVAGGFAGEVDLINYGTDAPNVFTVDAWKTQVLCEQPEQVLVNAKFPLISAQVGGLEIIGGFDEWTGTPMLYDATNNYYFANIEARFSEKFNFRTAGSWEHQLQIYNEEDDEWKNIVFGKFGQNWRDTILEDKPIKIITFDFSNPDKYRWSNNRNTLSVACDNTKGRISGGGQYEWGSQVTITAKPNYGYHFIQWTDGVTDNPRTITLIQDTIFTAEFAKNPVITYIYNQSEGTISGETTLADQATGNVTFEAVPNFGYHFVQWSDGITDNPRTIFLDKDTTFTAEFAIDRTGTCGDDLVLTWTYEPEEKVLTISGEGAFNENMQCGVEARTSLQKIVFADGVTSIGTSAFANCATLKTLVLSKEVKKINEKAFYNCENLTAIYNYRPTPTNIYSNTFGGVDKFECILYVPEGSVAMFKSDGSNWKDFYFIESMEASGDVYIVTYIDKDGAILDSESIKLQLPEAPEIEGFTFLKWVFVAGDVADGLIIQAIYETDSQTSAPAVYTNPANPAHKLIRNGNVYILTEDKTYTITGKAVK